MADVVPPPIAPPVTSSSSPPAPLALTVLNPPRTLTRAPLGTKFQGQIIASLIQGSRLAPTQGQYQIQIKTPLGTLTAQSPLALPNNAALELVLQSVGNSPQLLLTLLNGKPFNLFIPRVTPVLNPLTVGQTTEQAAGISRSQPLTQLTQGATVSATFLRPSSAINAVIKPGPFLTHQAAIPRGASTATPGVNINSSPIDTAVPASFSSKLAAAQLPLHRNASEAAIETGQRGLTLIPAGARATVRIITLQPPILGTLVPTPASTGTITSGQSLNGIVSGSTPQGHPIVTTHTGIFSLATRSALPAGTQVTFEILENFLLPPALEIGAGHILRTLHFAKTWPELSEALQTLIDVNPAVGQKIINSIIPRLDAQLTTNIIFFLAALRAGDLRGWLGEGPISILQRTKPGLVARLVDSFSQMARISEEPATGEWKGTPIPFLNGTEIEQIFLYTQRHKENSNPNGKKADTRFVVDVTVTHIGRLQLDGFLHQRRKHFDLILRSEFPLPLAMPEDIRNIFINAAGATGMKGGISFQAAPPNFVELIPPVDQNDSFSVTV